MPGRYRQTWIGGSNVQAQPLRVEVSVWFDGWQTPARRTYLVPPNSGWVENLDVLYVDPQARGIVGSVDGVSTDARIEVRCDRWCAVERAIYFAPLAAATISTLPAICREGNQP